MVEEHGTYPANARVDVDYSKGKPKIKFTYPNNGDSAKKQAKKQNRVGPHTIILIIITICFIYYPLSHFATLEPIEYILSPEECNFRNIIRIKPNNYKSHNKERVKFLL